MISIVHIIIAIVLSLMKFIIVDEKDGLFFFKFLPFAHFDT